MVPVWMVTLGPVCEWFTGSLCLFTWVMCVDGLPGFCVDACVCIVHLDPVCMDGLPGWVLCVDGSPGSCVWMGLY